MVTSKSYPLFSMKIFPLISIKTEIAVGPLALSMIPGRRDGWIRRQHQRSLQALQGSSLLVRQANRPIPAPLLTAQKSHEALLQSQM